MSELYQLPDGWEWQQLKNLTDFENGDRGKNYPSKDAFVDKGIPVISATSLNGWSVDLSGLNFISEERYNIIGGGKIKKGDILFCLRGSLGKCGVINNLERGVIASSLVIVRPQSKLYTKYLLYYFNSSLINEYINQYNNGAAQPNLSAKSLSLFYIPLPLLAEQKRIVQKLDALFERIDKAIALLQKNIDAADNFMNSVLNDVFSDLEQNYPSKAIKLFASVGTGVTPLKTNKTYYINGTISWITSKSTGEPYVNKADELITELALKECRLVLNPIGTLIVALYGQGKTRGQVSELLIEAATNQAVATILVDDSKCINKYLKWYFKKSYLELREKSNGGTQQNLNLSIIKSTVVPLPDDLSIQSKIVTYLDEVSTQIEQVKSVQQQKMQSLIDLKSSILDQAFHSKL